MLLNVPHCDSHPITRLFVSTPDAEFNIDADKSVSVVEVSDDATLVYAGYVRSDNSLDPTAVEQPVYSKPEDTVNTGAQSPVATEPEPNAGQDDEAVGDVVADNKTEGSETTSAAD